MPEKLSDNSWVYAVITNPGSEEQVLGQHDAETDISYIPVFLEKDHATQGLMQLNVAPGTRCEVQALLYSEITEAAVKNGFLLYLIDELGNILEKIAPAS